MKLNRYIISVCIVLAVTLPACTVDKDSILDKTDLGEIYEKDVFTDPYNALWFLNNVYKSMNKGFWTFGNAGFLGNAVDEGMWKATWDNAYKMSSGAWSTQDVLINYNPWNKYYTAIRAANKFMENADKIPDATEPLMNDAIRTRMKAEARFLRAMFYYELLKFYGGVPLITRVLTQYDTEELHKGRDSFETIVEFICTEAMAAAGELPHVDEYSDSEWGRITKGACYALVCRVRLMAASPLFNDPENPVGNEWRGDYDADKWVTAAEAARDFITQTRGYSLHYSTDPARYGDYEDLFLRRYSPEIILAYQQAEYGTDLERICLPGQFYNYSFGVTNNFPTLNTVAEYEVVKLDNNGDVVSTHLLGIDKMRQLDQAGAADPESGFNPQNPYVNRDPRFYQSIWYNNQPWPARGTTAANIIKFETFIGGKHDGTASGFYMTSYYNRKFLDQWANPTGYNSAPKVNHNFIIFRYAEILLNYAEAVNEAFGDPDATPAGYPMSAREAVNMVRARAKYPAYDLPDLKWPPGMPKNAGGKSISPLPAGLTKAEMKERIIHERWIEFYQEEQRYFDLNRWKKRSPVTIYKHKVTKDASAPTGFKFEIEPMMTKAWNDKFYLFPIHENEINKSPLLVQNPGWNLGGSGQ